MAEAGSALTRPLTLTLLPERLSIYRFDSTTALTDIGLLPGIWSITRTRQELSVVAAEGCCATADAEDPGWRYLYVAGPIPFDLTGIIAGLTATVAARNLPVFVLSTFDSDLLLVRSASLDQSLQALHEQGYGIQYDADETPPGRPTTHDGQSQPPAGNGAGV
ncbi:ACT domain-containing protein [Arthrobacter ruber]|uniref:ACT domain-containing protein n=1 Tax=Arthrobacter ruber TaxID=1258893 RepID=UPI000CF4F45F|nr:ACT domain-containing protein [Arthrobacter ruber]